MEADYKHLCLDCKFAVWTMAERGNRKHPMGHGKCSYEPPEIPIPASKFFHGAKPYLAGGYINRHGNSVIKKCDTYQQIVPQKAGRSPRQRCKA